MAHYVWSHKVLFLFYFCFPCISHFPLLFFAIKMAPPLWCLIYIFDTSISAENMWWCFVYVCAFSFHKSVLLCFLPFPSMLYSYVCCCSVTKLCLTPCNPTDYSLAGSSIHGISQARILEQVAVSFSRRSSWTRNWTRVSCNGRWILYHWAAREAPYIFYYKASKP